jgi:predicted dehydrogenase
LKKKYNWAVLGCGKIAHKFSSDLKLLPNANLYAAASRSLIRAKEFAGYHGFEKSFGSYEELAADPGVDVVYIATPHSHHRDHTILCLENGKAVLCEKAFALNSFQASEMVDTAREKGLFLMEAFWTRFQPAFQKTLEILGSGELGRARMMRSEFCFFSPYDPESRLFNLALGGSSLLDIGIYPVFWALQIFGKPAEILTTADLAPSGADRSISMIFKYPGGEMAQLASSFAVSSDTQTEIWCEKGFIRVTRVDPSTVIFTVSRSGQSEEVIRFHFDQGLGYSLEAAHVMECLDRGLTESPLLPLSYTFQQMKILDEIRAKAGVIYNIDNDL